MLKKLISHMGAFKKPAILGMVMTLGEVILEVAIPAVMANIIDIGVQTGDMSYIMRNGLYMILMALCSLLFGAFSAKFSSTAGTGFARNLREALFRTVQEFSFSNIDKFSTAGLVTRLTTDVTNTQMAFIMMMRIAVRSPLMLISAVFMAVRFNARLALIFLVVFPILAAIMSVMVFIVHPRFRKMLQEYDNMNGAIQENLIGIRVVKAFVREKFENDKFDKAAGRVRDTLLNAERIAVFVMPAMQLVMYGCIIAVLWYGGGMVIGGGLEVGQLTGFLTYTTQILVSLMMLGMVFMMFVISRASMQRIAEVLDEKPGIVNPANPRMDVPDGGVEFRDVGFRYRTGSGEDTLKSINLTIRPGQMVGIIGATGSAKTTLVQLIPRLYDVHQGAVLVGGHDVREYDLTALRDSVAMVLQKNVLFTGSIRDNLRWGDQHATEEEIEEACRIAQAHEFIRSFPNGYETDLGQGGVNVSGGQKQRLTIARALLKKPKIMILDDSTSAVDTATDAKIREGLRTTLTGMTTIIIAQRIQSVQDADQIIVMDEGRISAVGTHAELLRENAMYQEIYMLQQRGGEERVGA